MMHSVPTLRSWFGQTSRYHPFGLWLPGFLAFSLGILLACSSDEGGTAGPAAAHDASSKGGSGGHSFDASPEETSTGGHFIDASPQETSTGGSSGNAVVVPPESSFVQADIGSYALGEAIKAAESGDTGLNTVDGEGCEVMLAIVRDFKGANEPGGHPDFAVFVGADATLGLVTSALGTDRKPVYHSACEASFDPQACPFGQQTTNQNNFDQWYRYTENVNKVYQLFLKFAPHEGVYTFMSSAFFPLDNKGWGNTPGYDHNFGFTTELHTRFKYEGGEIFRFTGDDDVWVFINGELAVDLGGLHPPVSKTIELDAIAADFGLVKGKAYSIELFHAERRPEGSNFRVDTNLDFLDCGSVVLDRPK